jgi:hypothetical protein
MSTASRIAKELEVKEVKINWLFAQRKDEKKYETAREL